jgi:hypothetical protein
LNQDVQGRTRFQLLQNNAANKEGRLFFSGINNNNLLYGKGRLITVVTSTLTTVSVISCAAASQFIATTACRRRRNAQVFDQLQKQLGDDRMMVDYFSPTQVQS